MSYLFVSHTITLPFDAINLNQVKNCDGGDDDLTARYLVPVYLIDTPQFRRYKTHAKVYRKDERTVVLSWRKNEQPTSGSIEIEEGRLELTFADQNSFCSASPIKVMYVSENGDVSYPNYAFLVRE